MISGYNTDILHDGVVYHVQTEDKGRTNPVIESLIYVGGQVVVSKRESYTDLLEDGEVGDQAIAERMDRQHRVLMAAIKSGRFDEQFQALLDSGEVLMSGEEPSPEEQVLSAVDAIEEVAAARSTVTDSAIREAKARAAAANKPLDEVVLEYLKAETAREHLVLSLAENGALALGSNASLSLNTSSSETGEAVRGAQVTAKLISTVREPAVLDEGITDSSGHLVLKFALPDIESGSAALIISASSRLGSAEIKHLL